jgi:hypothetical protein
MLENLQEILQAFHQDFKDEAVDIFGHEYVYFIFRDAENNAHDIILSFYAVNESFTVFKEIIIIIDAHNSTYVDYEVVDDVYDPLEKQEIIDIVKSSVEERHIGDDDKYLYN